MGRLMKSKLSGRLVVDRIVNGKAVLLGSRRQQTILPLKDLPPGVREGDILLNGRPSKRETTQSKGRVQDLLGQILGKKKPADGR